MQSTSVSVIVFFGEEDAPPSLCPFRKTHVIRACNHLLNKVGKHGNTLYGLCRESIPVVYVYSLDNIANKKNI